MTARANFLMNDFFKCLNHFTRERGEAVETIRDFSSHLMRGLDPRIQGLDCRVRPGNEERERQRA
jgi:hypothetical protein